MAWIGWIAAGSCQAREAGFLLDDLWGAAEAVCTKASPTSFSVAGLGCRRLPKDPLLRSQLYLLDHLPQDKPQGAAAKARPDVPWGRAQRMAGIKLTFLLDSR